MSPARDAGSESFNNLGSTTAIRINLYHYVPTEYVCAIFVTLFALSTIVHLGQMLRYRIWWLLPTAVLAGVAEVIGWSGRLWSSRNPDLMIPYIIQITTTIIAPTPLIAANFILFGRIVSTLGIQYSFIAPMLYTIIFCFFDLIALIVQAIGGASAALAVENGNSPNKGGNIMLGGIAFQLASISVYTIFAIAFFWNYLHGTPVRKVEKGRVASTEDQLSDHTVPAVQTWDRRMQILVGSMTFSLVCLFIRSIYRTIELADGWTGRIISTEVLFNVLDGAMITLAMFTLNFAHPGFLMPQRPYDATPDGARSLTPTTAEKTSPSNAVPGSTSPV
ncbi:hypothetical protein PLICRDRAFT_177999 [Plicaturopsis crispa FD-325 SS-3]|nr:hypothetical protein PLICRDRAFT_177999 [Plicaturopsis crispa FD-325 SS-3]